MASNSFCLSVSCSTKGPLLTVSFHGLRSSLLSTFKPLVKERKQLPLRIQIHKKIKLASRNLLDALVDSIFKFGKEPMILQGVASHANTILNLLHGIVVESDYLNAISWMSCLEKGPWKFQFLFNEITTWSSSLNVEFHRVLRSGNGMADALAKLGVERETTGPNPTFKDKTARTSILGDSSFTWFEGEGMVHATYFNKDVIGNQTLSYRNRYIQSDTYTTEKQQNKPLFLPATKGTPPAILAAFVLNLLRFEKVNKDFNNTNVFEHAGKVYSIAENHFPYEIDISNLDTMNVRDLSGSWGRPFTSHPKMIRKILKLENHGYRWKEAILCSWCSLADGNELTHKVDLKLDRSTFCHDVGVTENYNVIMDYPLMIDVGRLVRGGSVIKYERNRRLRMGVMPRYGNQESIVWFRVETHCSFHIINSFEEGDEVVLIGCRVQGSIIPDPDYRNDKLNWFQRAFPPVSATDEDFDPSIDGTLLPRPYEWRLNMKTGTVKEGNLTEPEFGVDFPVISNSIMGMKNKYSYTQVVDTISSSNAGMPTFNKFVKLYFEEQENKFIKEGEKRIEGEFHVLEDNYFCSGLQFVEKPGGIDEDDRWFICYVHDEKTHISQVHIIDAKGFVEGPVAKITLPQMVPWYFHIYIEPRKTN